MFRRFRVFRFFVKKIFDVVFGAMRFRFCCFWKQGLSLFIRYRYGPTPIHQIDPAVHLFLLSSTSGSYSTRLCFSFSPFLSPIVDDKVVCGSDLSNINHPF